MNKARVGQRRNRNMRATIGGTEEAVDRWVLSRVPWQWCSVPMIMMHLGVFGQKTEEEKILASLKRLVARKAVGNRDKGLSMYKRLKDS
jgi:hypothetical protein